MGKLKGVVGTILAFGVWASAVLVNTACAGPITIAGPWARATPPGADNAAAYMTIATDGGVDRILGVRSDACREVQLHAHVERDGPMQMVRIEALMIATDRPATLEPGGDHLMLMGIKRPLEAGNTIRITLLFEKAGEVEVVVPILDGRTIGPARHIGHAE